jgi:uncharacterized protein YgiM (DUF1202 family)
MVTGAFFVWASIAFLAANLVPAIEGAVVLKADDARGPRFVANIEPVPPGSLNMIPPLPRVVVKAPPATAPAGVETAVASAATGERWRVVSGVNVRRDASSRSAVVGTLPRGETVRVIDSRRGWRLVEYESGIRGWVYGKYLTQDATVAAAE